MTVSAADDEAVFDQIEVEAERLRNQNPDHELLRFLEPAMQRQSWQESGLGDEWIERFDPEGDKTVITVRVAYLLALKNASGSK